ncbi:hypothetical protein PMI01_02540 [Caulobacter sp. AP07]|uniref:hypothetical protein n=1 Tax=Caulobacter sp. AP07 TaxID=1144304 RepID=UPI000271FC80|nr:hypothetical protein [Caulobacter sp. AP07]EJL32549.1 hypothetical protein PMI01_02540 [Caulobacter sp. AP07]
MTPALPDILRGNFLSLAIPAPPESQGEFMAGRVGVIALLSLLAAQEVERGTAARVWENAAIAAVLADAAEAYGVQYAGVAEITAADLSLAALDAANAALRRGLIALHEAVEAARDLPRHRAIVALYGEMAQARRLDLPPLPAR